MRLLLLPESAYDTVLETLEMDSRSLAFDPPLRAQIREALDTLKELPVTALKKRHQPADPDA